MSGAFWIVAWGLVATGCAAISGILASIKNRDYSFWIAWTFVFPPMVIILAAMPTHKGPRPQHPRIDEEDHHDRVW